MELERNLKVVKEVSEAANRRDWAGFNAGHKDSVIVYSPTTPEPTKDIASHSEAVRGLLDAFPDFVMKVERSFGQGEWICAEFTLIGTHKGPLKGTNGQTIPPTNKPIRLPMCSMIRFEDGKMAEERTYFDRVSLMSQLGVLPK